MNACVAKKKGGCIQVIFGPMFSGKSTELIRRIRRYTAAQRRCLMVKCDKDKRYIGADDADDKVVTHDDVSWKALSCKLLKNVPPGMLIDVDVIGIDEGQFFSDVVEFCERQANAGKTVVVAALDGTFQRKPFGRILDLVPLAEEVIKLDGICFCCFKSASFSKRLDATNDKLMDVGGNDKYVATCREHHPWVAKSAPEEKRDLNHAFGSGNVEIKVRFNSEDEWKGALERAETLTPILYTFVQNDVFYDHPKSRLKLRTFEAENGERAQVIRYDRIDAKEAKKSSFDKTEIKGKENVQSMRRTLESCYDPCGTVNTKRTLLMYENTRIHFDRVTDLGWFMELEAQLEENESDESGKERTQRIVRALRLENANFISCAYVDLINQFLALSR